MGSVSTKTERLLTPRTADASELVIGLLIKPHPRDIVVQLAALPSTLGSREAICDQNCPNQLTFPGITQYSGTKCRVQKQSEVLAHRQARPSEVAAQRMFCSTARHWITMSQLNSGAPFMSLLRRPTMAWDGHQTLPMLHLDPEDRSARSRPQVHLEANSVGLSVKKTSCSGAHLPPLHSSRLQPGPRPSGIFSPNRSGPQFCLERQY